MMPGYVDNHKP